MGMRDFVGYYGQVLLALFDVFTSTAGILGFWLPIVGWLAIWGLRRVRPGWSEWLKSHRFTRHYDIVVPVLALVYALLLANYKVFEGQRITAQARTQALATELNAARGEASALRATDDSTRPAATVEMSPVSNTNSGPDNNLTVRNIGGRGVFRARIRITAWAGAPSVPGDPTYDALWAHTGRNESDLFAGEEDRIILGGPHRRGGPAVLHFYNAIKQAPDSVVAKANEVFYLEVTIVSEPTMTVHPLVRHYQLFDNGINELLLPPPP